MLPCRCTIIKVIIESNRPVARCPWAVNYDVTCQTMHCSTDSFYSSINETLITWHRRVFTNWLQHNCGKKTTIETTRAIWSKPLFTPCVALDQFNHDVYIFMVPRRYNLIKAIIACHAHCLLLVNHDVACLTFHGFPDFFHNVEKRVFYKLVKSLSSTSLC